MHSLILIRIGKAILLRLCSLPVIILRAVSLILPVALRLSTLGILLIDIYGIVLDCRVKGILFKEYSDTTDALVILNHRSRNADDEALRFLVQLLEINIRIDCAS